eukprot:6187565-Pleurochrysis_carterae.AAC.2
MARRLARRSRASGMAEEAMRREPRARGGRQFAAAGIHGAAQVLRLDHVPARTDEVLTPNLPEDAREGKHQKQHLAPSRNTQGLIERYPVLTPRRFVFSDRARVVSECLKRRKAAVELLVHLRCVRVQVRLRELGQVVARMRGRCKGGLDAIDKCRG